MDGSLNCLTCFSLWLSRNSFKVNGQQLKQFLELSSKEHVECLILHVSNSEEQLWCWDSLGVLSTQPKFAWDFFPSFLFFSVFFSFLFVYLDTFLFLLCVYVCPLFFFIVSFVSRSSFSFSMFVFLFSFYFLLYVSVYSKWGHCVI